MGSIPLFTLHDPATLGYEEKEHFTLPRIIHTFTEHSYLTPLLLLQHGVSSLVQHFMTRL